jgi:hypothetical protein
MSRFLPLVLLCACSSAAPDGTWVAKDVAGDAWLAIEVQDETAVAYVCGGAQTLATHTRWLAGDAEEHTVLDRDGFRLELDIHDEAVSGTFTGAGTTGEFTAARVPDGGVAGLFNVVTDGCRTGVIVASGDVSDAQGAFCSAVTDELAQVTPMMPLTQTSDGLGVVAHTEMGDVELFVREVVVAEVAAEIAQ